MALMGGLIVNLICLTRALVFNSPRELNIGSCWLGSQAIMQLLPSLNNESYTSFLEAKPLICKIFPRHLEHVEISNRSMGGAPLPT